MTVKSKLKSLFLFLAFKDSTEHYVAENSDALMVLMAFTLILLIPLAGFLFSMIQISIFLFFGMYVFLCYILLQLLHVYDYHRARR